jgi:hypothetical protein
VDGLWTVMAASATRDAIGARGIGIAREG